MPITSLLFAGRLIARFGAAPVVTAGILFFVAAAWRSGRWLIGLTPNVALVALGMIPTGIGVGLAFPTLMGVGASALPPSSFATGSGVINMIRQAALAIGVAIFVAIVGSPASPAQRLAGFHRGMVDHGGDRRARTDPDLCLHQIDGPIERAAKKWRPDFREWRAKRWNIEPSGDSIDAPTARTVDQRLIGPRASAGA